MTALRISRVEPRCDVLGPGTRFVVWVQGCPLRCRGCVAPGSLSFDGGHDVEIGELADRILAEPELAGVTFSGGEPFAQAEGLAALVRLVRAVRPEFSVMSYSGFTLERLQRRGTPPQRDLLDLLDILVDGPYRQELHGALRWRGSSNQRINLLSDRHPEVAGLPDVSVGLQMSMESDGMLRWAGVPPVQDFAQHLEQKLAERGLSTEEVTP
jgi:anaerobic ribonucleoside-triphosphate reductase activating protein